MRMASCRPQVARGSPPHARAAPRATGAASALAFGRLSSAGRTACGRRRATAGPAVAVPSKYLVLEWLGGCTALGRTRTELGDVALRLRPDAAPRTVEHVCGSVSTLLEPRSGLKEVVWWTPPCTTAAISIVPTSSCSREPLFRSNARA